MGRMARARAKHQRPPWDFGRKVQQLLLDRSRASGHPVRAADLARDLDLDHGTVMDWIALGRSPRSKTGNAVAEWFRVDPSWLLNDETSYPPPPATAQSLEALLRSIPSDERRRLFDVLRDPVERAAWLAQWEARQGRRS